MNHSALKTEINETTKVTHDQRREATRLILEGRKLRFKGRTLTAGLHPNAEGEALLQQGWDSHSKGMDLLYDAESGCYDRRHLGLAAALLNGTPYLKSESSIGEHTDLASASMISPIIAEFLPEADAWEIAQMWLDGEDIRALIRPQQVEEEVA